MKRRDFLIQSALSASIASLLPTTSLWGMPGPEYTGPLFMMVQAQGGWDVTSFCDPKMNAPGEPIINNWANGNETQQVGNIRYAPFAGNQAFFEKYYQDMLVINGIDAQTNSHDAGRLHNWSGRISVGYPAIPALVASIYAPDMPIAWVNNGGYSETANLIRFTRMDDPFLLKNIAYPAQTVGDQPSPFLEEAEWAAMEQAQQAQLNDLRNATDLLPWQRRHRENYHSARENAEGLRAFADIVPPENELEGGNNQGRRNNSIRRQAQLALLAFKSGSAMAADIVNGAFDTHANHDQNQSAALSDLTDGIDYLWDYAEELGLADRLTVLVASDFGRTPRYNSGQGKDHWPIGSALIMQKDAPWGNRVVGVTDDGHNPAKINPDTLQVDEANGTRIFPKHIMTAFRQLAGIDNHAITQQFPYFDNQVFDMFNTGLQTPQGFGDPRNTVR